MTSGAAMLAEREAELTQIQALVDATTHAMGRGLLVEAPPGLGKSALLKGAISMARDAGLEVLAARGTDSERDWAYGVVRQLFEPVVAAAGPAERGSIFDGAAALAKDVMSADATSRRRDPGSMFAVTHGLYWLAANLADEHPLLIVVDDLHWSDLASLRYLGYLGRRIDGLPISLLVATRPPEAQSEAVASLVSEMDGTEMLRPSPLSRLAVSGMVAYALEKPCGERFASACHSVTGGNPFLMTELIRSLDELGIEPIDAAADDVLAIGPERVAHHFLLRLAGLDAAATTLARVAAVLGPSTDLFPAAEIAGLAPGEAGRAADALSASGILEDGRPLKFVHPIISTSIAAELPTGRRVAIHEAAARKFATDLHGGERSASHLLATDPIGERWVVEVLTDAADRALDRGAPDTAVSFLRRLLDEPLSDIDRGLTLASLGFAESYVGSPDAHGHLRQAIDITESPGRRVGIMVALGRVLQLAGQSRDAVDVYQSAVRGFTRPDHDAETVLRAALLGAAQLDTATAGMAVVEASWLRAHVEHDSSAPHEVFGPLATYSAFSGEDAARTAALAMRALDGVRLLPERVDRPPYFYHATTALLFAEHFDDVEKMLDEALSDAIHLGAIQHVVGLSAERSLLYSRTGRLLDAEADARQALDMGAPPLFAAEAASVLIDVLVDRGEVDAADGLLIDIGFDLDAGSNIFSGHALVARGRLRLAQGRIEEAVHDLLAAGELQKALQADSPTVLGWRGEAVLPMLMLGHKNRAVALAAEELELAHRVNALRAVGRALWAGALTAEGDRQVELFENAVATLAASGAPLEHARVLVDFGSALRRSGRRSSARKPLSEGLDLAHRSGARALVERGRTELAAAGARPRRMAMTGVDALTPSERRVAELAGRGRTNREIAQSLFITTRTVEGHLTHVYQKLGVASRNELPSLLSGESPE